MTKAPSIGIFIRDTLKYTSPPIIKRYPYELWKEYNESRLYSGNKGIKYNNFLKYIYVLKQLGLVKETSSPRGRFLVSKPPNESPVPNTWTLKWIQLAYRADRIENAEENLSSPAWENPFRYYRILHNSEPYFSSLEMKKEWQKTKLVPKLAKHFNMTEEEAKRKYEELRISYNESKKIDKIKHPSHEETTLIRISKELKDLIDRERGTTTVNGYIIELQNKINKFKELSGNEEVPAKIRTDMRNILFF